MDNPDHLRGIFEAVVGPLGVEIFSVTVKPYQGTAHIELLADLPGGGISLDQCAQINRDVRRHLESEGLFGGDYTLSVSSPGLDWPLKSARDFRRVIGQTLEVFHQDPLEDDSAQRVVGVLAGVDEQGVRLENADGDHKLVFEHIQKAVVMI